jgi:uncharacterized protein YlxW (UPF0749 family)
MATPKVNSYLSNTLADLKAKETAATQRQTDLQTALDNHNADLKDLQAAIKHLETSPNAQVPEA